MNKTITKQEAQDARKYMTFAKTVQENETIEDKGDYYEIVALPEPSLEELKESKKVEINKIRDEKEQSGFVYDGSTFDSDSISYQRLIGANITASSAIATNTEFSPIEWTLADNTTRLMSASDFLAIIPTFATFSGQLHYQAGVLKAQVEQATTIEEVEAIVWE